MIESIKEMLSSNPVLLLFMVLAGIAIVGGGSADRPALTGHEDSSLGLGFIGFTIVV